MAVDEMTTAEIVAAVDEHKAQQRSEKGAGERVVLRGVQVIVLDDLSEPARREIVDRATGDAGYGLGRREAWIPEALEPGSFDAAVEAHAGRSGEQGNKPGRYRAMKKAAWLEKGPRVIEPPIA